MQYTKTNSRYKQHFPPSSLVSVLLLLLVAAMVVVTCMFWSTVTVYAHPAELEPALEPESGATATEAV